MPFAGAFRPLVCVEWPKSTDERRSRNANGRILSFTPRQFLAFQSLNAMGVDTCVQQTINDGKETACMETTRNSSN